MLYRTILGYTGTMSLPQIMMEEPIHLNNIVK